MNPNTTITENDFVPPALWGRDHYSTLAYVETKLVDNGRFAVKGDAHMRQNRRHYRLLGGGGVAMQPEHGSQLADGTYLPWHDDWCCVQDMLDVGLFEGTHDDWDVGFKLKLTEKGFTAVAAVRRHKATGGSFSNCGPAVVAAIGPV